MKETYVVETAQVNIRQDQNQVDCPVDRVQQPPPKVQTTHCPVEYIPRRPMLLF